MTMRYRPTPASTGNLYNEFGDIFAHFVEYAAECARQLGWKIPKYYTVGTKYIGTRADAWVVEWRIRMNDVTYDFGVRFPNPEDGVSLYTRQREDFMKRVQDACAALVKRFGEHHKLLPTEEESMKLIAAGVLDDTQSIEQRAKAVCRTSKFIPEVRPRVAQLQTNRSEAANDSVRRDRRSRDRGRGRASGT